MMHIFVRISWYSLQPHNALKSCCSICVSICFFLYFYHKTFMVVSTMGWDVTTQCFYVHSMTFSFAFFLNLLNGGIRCQNITSLWCTEIMAPSFFICILKFFVFFLQNFHPGAIDVWDDSYFFCIFSLSAFYFSCKICLWSKIMEGWQQFRGLGSTFHPIQRESLKQNLTKNIL